MQSLIRSPISPSRCRCCSSLRQFRRRRRRADVLWSLVVDVLMRFFSFRLWAWSLLLRFSVEDTPSVFIFLVYERLLVWSVCKRMFWRFSVTCWVFLILNFFGTWIRGFSPTQICNIKIWKPNYSLPLPPKLSLFFLFPFWECTSKAFWFYQSQVYFFWYSKSNLFFFFFLLNKPYIVYSYFKF